MGEPRNVPTPGELPGPDASWSLASLRREWLFLITQRFQSIGDLGGQGWNEGRDASSADLAHTLPEPASRLEALLLRGLLLEVLRHRLGETGDDLLRAALGPLSRLLPSSCPATEAGPPDAEQVRQFLERHFRDHLTLASIRRAHGRTIQSLEESFRRAYGTTIHKYLEHRRMLTAFQLLVDSDTKTEFLHAQVGYRSRSAFYRAFWRAFGRSPGQVRKALRQSRQETAFSDGSR